MGGCWACVRHSLPPYLRIDADVDVAATVCSQQYGCLSSEVSNRCYCADSRIPLSLTYLHNDQVSSLSRLCVRLSVHAIRFGPTHSHCNHIFTARHQFGTLQHKTFPIYFSVSIALSSVLLLMWTSTHPDVVSYIASPTHVDVAQAYALASVLLNQALNQLVIGPLTSRYGSIP